MYEIHYVLLAVLHPPLIHAALALVGPQCGSKNCSRNEFCNTFNNHCEKCETVCNGPSHNFDSKICENQCQDYLHDIKYGKSQLEDEIKHLQRQESTNTALLVVILVILLAICAVRLAYWLRKRRLLSICFVKKLKPVKSPTTNSTQPVPTVTNNENLSPINIQITRGNAEAIGANVLSTSGTDISSPQTLTTPITNRYPAENSTVEYSYDNAGLQVTPSTDKPPRGPESTF